MNATDPPHSHRVGGLETPFFRSKTEERLRWEKKDWGPPKLPPNSWELARRSAHGSEPADLAPMSPTGDSWRTSFKGYLMETKVDRGGRRPPVAARQRTPSVRLQGLLIFPTRSTYWSNHGDTDVALCSSWGIVPVFALHRRCVSVFFPSVKRKAKATTAGKSPFKLPIICLLARLCFSVLKMSCSLWNTLDRQDWLGVVSMRCSSTFSNVQGTSSETSPSGTPVGRFCAGAKKSTKQLNRGTIGDGFASS